MLYSEIDPTILKALPNPNTQSYQVQIDIPECTFLGVKQQPDFAYVTINLIPKDKIVELKSVKLYIYQLRDIIVSYERLLGILFQHFNSVYQPQQLTITLRCAPRGGISSTLTMSSHG